MWRSTGRPVTIGAVIVALVAALALAWTTSPSSSADPAAPAPKGSAQPTVGDNQRSGATAGRHGHGRTYKGQWFGTWRFGSRLGFCIEFDQGHPDTNAIKAAPSQLPRLSRAASARVKFIVANYGTTRNANDAAASAIAVWKLQNIKKFTTYYAKMVKAKAIPKAIQRRANAILAQSKNHGPYALTMSLGAGLPGQIVNGTVTVRAANRTVVAGRAMTLTGTNAAIVSRSARTSALGVYAFRARINGAGQIRVGAKLTFNSMRDLWITSPTAGAQRIVMAGGVQDSVSAFRTSVRAYNGSRMVNTCDGDCKGVAPIKLTMATFCGSKPMKQIVKVDGKIVATMVASGCGKDVVKTISAGDEARVTTEFCYTNTPNGACATAWAKGPSLLAECPPMVTFRYEATCDCEAPKQFTFTVVGPSKPTRRTFTAVLEVSGQKTQTLSFTGNKNVTFKQITALKGTEVKLTAKVLKQTVVLDQLKVG